MSAIHPFDSLHAYLKLAVPSYQAKYRHSTRPTIMARRQALVDPFMTLLGKHPQLVLESFEDPVIRATIAESVALCSFDEDGYDFLNVHWQCPLNPRM